jgi:hypothetical protein
VHQIQTVDQLCAFLVRFTYPAEWYWKRGVQPALKRIAVNAFEALKLQNVNDLQKKRGVFTRSGTFAQ